MTKYNENDFHERQIKYQEKVNEILEKDIINKMTCLKNNVAHYPNIRNRKKKETTK
ncbi:MAG TPA: hypothetical protein GX009_12845 [Candidatus Atribacteria bacterium]|jgi:hypothetical protein|nr:hypothetical protein [Candidatus Atribacteria bacterium]